MKINDSKTLKLNLAVQIRLVGGAAREHEPLIPILHSSKHPRLSHRLSNGIPCPCLAVDPLFLLGCSCQFATDQVRRINVESRAGQRKRRNASMRESESRRPPGVPSRMFRGERSCAKQCLHNRRALLIINCPFGMLVALSEKYTRRHWCAASIARLFIRTRRDIGRSKVLDPCVGVQDTGKCSAPDSSAASRVYCLLVLIDFSHISFESRMHAKVC